MSLRFLYYRQTSPAVALTLRVYKDSAGDSPCYVRRWEGPDLVKVPDIWIEIEKDVEGVLSYEVRKVDSKLSALCLTLEAKGYRRSNEALSKLTAYHIAPVVEKNENACLTFELDDDRNLKAYAAQNRRQHTPKKERKTFDKRKKDVADLSDVENDL